MYEPRLSYFVRFWYILYMVSFTRRVRKLRIAGGRFWCAACNSIGHAARLLYLYYKFTLSRMKTAATPLVDHGQQQPQSSQWPHDGGVMGTGSGCCLRSELADGRPVAGISHCITCNLKSTEDTEDRKVDHYICVLSKLEVTNVTEFD